MPLERTTLCGVSVYASIAGKARQELANKHDAIFDQFITTHKNGQVFKPCQINLTVIINNNNFQCAEDRREEMLKFISKKKPACTCTYYALMCLTGTRKAFVRKFSVRSVSHVNVLQ